MTGGATPRDRESAEDAYARELSDAEIAARAHRDFVGGLWHEIGRLQLDFLRARGLRPEHTLLDVGCGALRGGIHFVRYLEPGHYFGIDRNRSLLEAGYEQELAHADFGDGTPPVDLRPRLPRANLVCDAFFAFDRFGRRFDLALAQSLFTHLPLAAVRRCLERLAPCLDEGARLYASVLACPDDHPVGAPRAHEGGAVVSHDDRDPYHQRPSDLRECARGLPWRVEWIGDWGHPRGLAMVAFERVRPG